VKTFENWCILHGVQPLPAAPADVARFIADCAPLGMEKIWPLVVEISKAHSLAGLADPTLGGAAAGAVNAIAEVAPPKSWPKENKLRFLSLPYDLQIYMAAHEDKRDVEIRKAHGERDKAKGALSLVQKPKVTNGADSHPAA
jgi:hypothetical protein